MDTVRAKAMSKRAAMTVKRLRRIFDQRLSIGEQCSESVSRLKSEGFCRTTVPRHLVFNTTPNAPAPISVRSANSSSGTSHAIRSAVSTGLASLALAR